jgi:hypothetical protein
MSALTLKQQDRRGALVCPSCWAPTMLRMACLCGFCGCQPCFNAHLVHHGAYRV